MARPVKLTKFSAENALARTGSVTGAAAYSGVSRRTFQRFMRANGIVLVAAKDRFDALLEPVSSQATEPLETSTKPVEPKPMAERNIPKLSVNDFTGHCFGDAGRTSFAGTYGLLGRYHRLRSK
jgi:hypothetical protein